MTHIVAVGASGRKGLDDLKRFLHALPLSMDAIVLAVLHRSPDHRSWLKEILAEASEMPVIIAGQGQRLQVGTCYIGEPDNHLTLRSVKVAGLVLDDRTIHRNRTIDALFASVAKRARKGGIGVVLSGGLDDGSRGLSAIHHAAGTTMTLLTSGTGHPWEDSMPESARAYDAPIDFVGSVEDIATAIACRAA